MVYFSEDIGKLRKERGAVMLEKRRRMEVFDGDGKTRDERETCFPNQMQKHQIEGACTQ